MQRKEKALHLSIYFKRLFLLTMYSNWIESMVDELIPIC